MSADMFEGTSVAGAKNWQQKNRRAYGISMSLYDQHPITGKISGLGVHLSAFAFDGLSD